MEPWLGFVIIENVKSLFSKSEAAKTIFFLVSLRINTI
ncbi:MAG: hypothetical protein ACD_79C01404G0001 [uncultured bacterium]|nr:MAG: hypothetical protein ACD_79C01404G0001 [uncultured bacterium]